MNQSEQIDLLSAALVEFNKTAPEIKKNSINPHFKNRYADLASIIEATRTLLANAGLSVVQLPDGDDLITRLVHKSGQWISSRTALKFTKQDAQGYGSALTYARRYALSAILNLAADDDDGEAASRPVRSKPTQAPVKQLACVIEDKYEEPAVRYYEEKETRQKLAKMFTPQTVGYVLEWAASSERKKPTPVDKFTATHFESLEKNRAVVEKYIEDKIFEAKKDPNHIEDNEAWAPEEGEIL
jgi:hypothetical protein